MSSGFWKDVADSLPSLVALALFGAAVFHLCALMGTN